MGPPTMRALQAFATFAAASTGDGRTGPGRERAALVEEGAVCWMTTPTRVARARRSGTIAMSTTGFACNLASGAMLLGVLACSSKRDAQTSAQASRPRDGLALVSPVSAAHRACVKDEDCSLVTLACCPCGNEVLSRHDEQRSRSPRSLPRLSDCRSRHTDSRSRHTDSRSRSSDSRSRHTDSRSWSSDSRSRHTDSRSRHTDSRSRPSESRSRSASAIANHREICPTSSKSLPRSIESLPRHSKRLPRSAERLPRSAERLANFDLSFSR